MTFIWSGNEWVEHWIGLLILTSLDNNSNVNVYMFPVGEA